MASITKRPVESRIEQNGARGISESILAGPGSGSNKFTLRRIKIKPDGCTARVDSPMSIVYFIQKGKVTLSHDSGELDQLIAGDTATLLPYEIHHFHNINRITAEIIKVASQ